MKVKINPCEGMEAGMNLCFPPPHPISVSIPALSCPIPSSILLRDDTRPRGNGASPCLAPVWSEDSGHETGIEVKIHPRAGMEVGILRRGGGGESPAPAPIHCHPYCQDSVNTTGKVSGARFLFLRVVSLCKYKKKSHIPPLGERVFFLSGSFMGKGIPSWCLTAL